MYKIAVMGDKDSIYGFATLGMETFPVSEAAEAAHTLRDLAEKEYAIVYITEGLADRIENGLRPALVIAVPVGFVNVIEGKERIWSVCGKYGVPAIVARGRKGGSTVAAAVLNALLYSAAGTLDPKARGWL